MTTPHGASLPRLAASLRSLDGRPYPAYRSIEGIHESPVFALHIDRVQPDPFAPPTRCRVIVPQSHAGFRPDWLATPLRRIALADLMTRVFHAAISGGSGERGGGLSIDLGRQEILERTSCQVTAQQVEVRFTAALPARGRTILGAEAAVLLCERLPHAVAASLLSAAHDPAVVERHLATVEDTEALRDQLAGRGLVAFVADGAVLPRAGGVSPLPLAGAVPFVSPPELRVTLDAPHAGPALLVGGGFHGKSTLLDALALGVYNHVPGDGRERVVTLPGAVKVRAESGRSVAGVDISPFIADLPQGRTTRRFSTPNASGSTSQAAAIIEALELGAIVLLMDEDTSAANFMVRDARMQRLVRPGREPITPFVDRVRELWTQFGISTILVMGGSGDYFDGADTAIALEEYRPRLVTAEARRIAAEYPTGRVNERRGPMTSVNARAPLPESLPMTGDRRLRVTARGVDALTLGDETVDLRAVEQLVEPGQVRAVGAALTYAVRLGYLDGRRPLRHLIELMAADMAAGGLDALSGGERRYPGDLALPRTHEIGAALNRLRSLLIAEL
ncbi:MAG: ABC-ATPase domain-containing protein [Chloroflexi bacterium]|nr:ABC-ATPase domain-containing protein [Chloroflexota bacterium]